MQSDFSTVVSNKNKQKKKKQGLGDTDRGWGWFPELRLNPGLKWDQTRCPIKSASVPGSSHVEILELRDLQVLPVTSKRPLKKSMKSLAFIFTLFFTMRIDFLLLYIVETIEVTNHCDQCQILFFLPFDQTNRVYFSIIFTF